MIFQNDNQLVECDIVEVAQNVFELNIKEATPAAR
jgi:hypothetical protein